MHRNRNNKDFDDFMIDDQQTFKKPTRNTKPKQDQFNFLDDEEDAQPLKLPTIKQEKISQPPAKPRSRQKESFDYRQEQQGSYFEEVEEDRKASDKSIKGKEKERETPREREHSNKVEEGSNDYGNNDNQNYEQQFDDYDNDFEQEQVQQVVQKVIEKPRVPQKKPQPKYNPAKPSTTQNIPVNKSVTVVKNKIQTRPKQTSLYKSESRKSVKSGRTNLSLRKHVDATREEERKFSGKVEKNFPEVNLEKQRAEEIEKLNEKARALMRELNNELNEILNKVTLDQKKPVVERKNVDDTIKLLTEAKKNNAKIIDRGNIQLKKLKQRAGEVKDQEYQINITMDISTFNDKKKELEKAITQMKAGYNIIEKKTATISKTTIESLKSNLIHLRKESEKNSAKDKEMEEKLKSLEIKGTTLTRKHEEVVDKAHDKGIEIQSTVNIVNKLKELEQKEKNIKKNVDNTVNLYKTKADIVNNENQRIKRDIVNCQAQVKDIYNQIVDLANKSSALIQKQKQNPKLMKNVLHSLEVFSKSLANPAPMFEGITSYDVNSPAGSLYRRKKNNSKLSNDSELSSHQNKSSRDAEKQRSPVKSFKDEQKEKEKNSFKPNFKKDKERHHEDKVQGEGKESVNLVQEIEKEVEKTKVAVNNLKPTFNFRKKHQNKEEGDKDKESPKQPHKQPEPTPAPTPAPSYNITQNTQPINKPFTRFRRNMNQPSNQGYSLTQPEQPKPQVKIQPPAEVEEPTQPKKFMLKRRGNQSDADSGYNPTIQKNQDNSREATQRSEAQEHKNRFITKEQNKSNSYNPPSYQPTNSYQPTSYQPTTTTAQQNPPPRVRNFSNRPKQPQPSYSFNPTPTPPKQQKPAPVEPPKPTFQPKQREGRIKKQKFNIEPEKKGGNIYSHAEDLTNEFMVKEEPKVVDNNSNMYNNFGNARVNKVEEEEMDLNKLIGNNRRRNDDDDQDIVFQDKKAAGKEKEKEKKATGRQNQNDFFGFDL